MLMLTQWYYHGHFHLFPNEKVELGLIIVSIIRKEYMKLVYANRLSSNALLFADLLDKLLINFRVLTE